MTPDDREIFQTTNLILFMGFGFVVLALVSIVLHLKEVLKELRK